MTSPDTKEKLDTVTHVGFYCDGCGMKPITGIRYRCQTCKNFDLCDSCFTKQKRASDAAIADKSAEKATDKANDKVESDAKKTNHPLDHVFTAITIPILTEPVTHVITTRTKTSTRFQFVRCSCDNNTHTTVKCAQCNVSWNRVLLDVERMVACPVHRDKIGCYNRADKDLCEECKRKGYHLQLDDESDPLLGHMVVARRPVTDHPVSSDDKTVVTVPIASAGSVDNIVSTSTKPCGKAEK